MNARALFVGADSRPRAPWRLLAFLLLSVGCLVVVWFTLGPLIAPLQTRLAIPGLTESYCICVAFLLAHWMTFRTFDKRPWSFVGLDREAAKPRPLRSGLMLGAFPIGLPSLLLVATGLLAFQSAPDGSWLLVAAQTLVLLAPAALYEELLSRGYIFATLREWLGPRVAVTLTSLAFGLLHLANPNVSVLSIVLVTLAGVYLAGVLLATKSLYAAWLAHFAWNWTMAALLHVPVSGISLGRPDYQLVETGPDWITGGPWGPEGGAAAGLGMLGALAYLYWSSRLSAVGSRLSALCSRPWAAPRAESQEPRAESPEPSAESSKPRAESSKPRAESSKPRAESSKPRAESREPRVDDEFLG